VLLSIVLLAQQSFATGWENAGSLGAAVAGKAAAFAPLAAARARILSGKTNSADLSILFDLGAKPEAADLEGWYAGRRFTENGPAAQLLVGGESYDDPSNGPIGGRSFKLMVFGPNVAGVVPADLYDDPGTYVVDTVKELMAEKGKEYSALGFSATGATWTKGQGAFELRKWGRYLIVKYPEGGYGYFFKKISGNNAPPAGTNSGLKQQSSPVGILPLPGSEQLSAMFEAGSAPAETALTGWFAGRRYTSDGPVAALVVGTEIYDNPDAGPIDGSKFKVLVFGPDKTGVVPVELYDIGGSAMINGVAWNVRETAGQWTTTRTDESVVTQKADRAYEVRQSGDFLVVRYPEGYGYFFKKIR
ncbi:MAG: hypothetical protein HY925_05110, partial [Elusimicrobia bacterium]|nr:hypothetical protein [Elusimicrobiota bacterium]